MNQDDLELLDRIAADAISPISPPAGIRAQLLETIRHTPQRDDSVPSADESLTVRAEEGTWKTIAPGARTKKLAKDGRRVSFLLDLDPDAVVDAHDHGGGEDSYVIRGSCHIGALALNAGDFHHVESGAHHGDVVASGEGCLLLITLEMPAAA